METSTIILEAAQMPLYFLAGLAAAGVSLAIVALLKAVS
jgi:hypothetical protein